MGKVCACVRVAGAPPHGHRLESSVHPSESVLKSSPLVSLRGEICVHSILCTLPCGAGSCQVPPLKPSQSHTVCAHSRADLSSNDCSHLGALVPSSFVDLSSQSRGGPGARVRGESHIDGICLQAQAPRGGVHIAHSPCGKLPKRRCGWWQTHRMRSGRPYLETRQLIGEPPQTMPLEGKTHPDASSGVLDGAWIGGDVGGRPLAS